MIFGSVNANLQPLRAGRPGARERGAGWLERMITRRVPLERFAEALDSRPEDVKVVLDLQA